MHYLGKALKIVVFLLLLPINLLAAFYFIGAIVQGVMDIVEFVREVPVFSFILASFVLYVWITSRKEIYGRKS